MPKPPEKEEVPPYEMWGCFGQYEMMNKPWTESGVCSDGCAKRFDCWRIRNDKDKKEKDND